MYPSLRSTFIIVTVFGSAMKFGLLIYGNLDQNNCMRACRKHEIEFDFIDITAADWLKRCVSGKFDGFLVRLPFRNQTLKSVCDERLYFLEHHLNFKCYPSFDESYIYENKRNMATWLETYGFPHAKTCVFTNKADAFTFLKGSDFPLVRKSNIGSASSGVEIISNEAEARKLVKNIFRTWQSDQKLRFVIPRGFNKLLKINKCNYFKDGQKDYVIFQEYLNIEFEWRIVKIGNSLFGHKKLIGKKGFASGSNSIGWERPPNELMKLASKICSVGNFSSMAIDIIQTREGDHYVNELQTVFGAYAPSQMYLNGAPGRFIPQNDSYEFEEGIFCENGCWDLRLEDFINQLNETKVL